MKILIIEDDSFLLDLYNEVFTQEGYEVLTAENGAIGLVKSHEPDLTLILLDIMMPKMTGFDVLDQLKANETTKNIPVFMLTNIADQKDIDLAMQKGASKYIVKSQFLPKQIVESVSTFLGFQKS